MAADHSTDQDKKQKARLDVQLKVCGPLYLIPVQIYFIQMIKKSKMAYTSNQTHLISVMKFCIIS